jgi:hypothetical protein
MKKKELPITTILESPKITLIKNFEELVALVEKRVEKTGHDAISSLAIISTLVEVEGETIKERAENLKRLCQEAAKKLGITWPDESSENPEKTPNQNPSQTSQTKKKEPESFVQDWMIRDAELRALANPPGSDSGNGKE